jgi:hypothetical protein
MWTFIPRLPRQLDWENRTFKWISYSVKDLIETMNTKKNESVYNRDYRGQVIVKDAKTSDEIVIPGSSGYFLEDELVFYFNNTRELNMILEKYQLAGHPISRIEKIYIYEHGYFLQEKIEPKKMSLLY